MQTEGSKITSIENDAIMLKVKTIKQCIKNMHPLPDANQS